MSEVVYTDEEQAFLDKCNEDFANRYTDSDYDYNLHIRIGMSGPPCVEPWYPKEEVQRNEQSNRDGRQRNESERENSNKRKR